MNLNVCLLSPMFLAPTFSFFLAAAESFFVCWLFLQTKFTGGEKRIYERSMVVRKNHKLAVVSQSFKSIRSWYFHFVLWEFTCKTILQGSYKLVKFHVRHGVHNIWPRDGFPLKKILHSTLKTMSYSSQNLPIGLLSNWIGAGCGIKHKDTGSLQKSCLSGNFKEINTFFHAR